MARCSRPRPDADHDGLVKRTEGRTRSRLDHDGLMKRRDARARGGERVYAGFRERSERTGGSGVSVRPHMDMPWT